MNKEEKAKGFGREEGEIRIDYDNIDVSDIMDQIKKRVAKEPKREREELRPQHPFTLEEIPGKRGKVKRLIFKIMKPFAPLVRMMILPVSGVFKESILSLEQMNRRLDVLAEYTKLLHSLSHNIVVELSKLKIEEENLKLKTRILEKDFEFLGKREKALERQLLK